MKSSSKRQDNSTNKKDNQETKAIFRTKKISSYDVHCRKCQCMKRVTYVFPDLLLVLECDHFEEAKGDLEVELIRGKKKFTNKYDET